MAELQKSNFKLQPKHPNNLNNRMKEIEQEIGIEEEEVLRGKKEELGRFCGGTANQI